MSYKAKYVRTPEEQVIDILKPMLQRGVGTSKNEAKADGTISEKIFSFKTYDTYVQQGSQFARYIYQEHGANVKHGEKYVPEYLQFYLNKTDSVSSVTTARAALNKMYHIKPGDKYYVVLPERKRVDYKRSRRDDVESRTHFSEINNKDIVHFCKATGCRRNVLERLRGSDYVTRDDLRIELAALNEKCQSNPNDLTDKESRHMRAIEDALHYFPDKVEFLHHRLDKGGKERYAPFVGPYADKAAAKVRNTPSNQKVWTAVPTKMDVHQFRSEYSVAIYREYARDIDEIPYDKINAGTGHKYQSEVYACRGDRKGECMDKFAMLIAAKSLGHSRIDIIAQSYSRGI